MRSMVEGARAKGARTTARRKPGHRDGAGNGPLTPRYVDHTYLN